MNKKILGIAAVIGVLYFATRKKSTATAANPATSTPTPSGAQPVTTNPTTQVQPVQSTTPTDNGQQSYYNPAPPASGGSSSGSSGTPWYGGILGDVVSGAINLIPPITIGGGSSSGNSGSGTTASASSTTQGTGNIPKTGSTTPASSIPTSISTVAIAGPLGAQEYYVTKPANDYVVKAPSKTYGPGEVLGDIIGYNPANTGVVYRERAFGNPRFVYYKDLA